MQTKHSFNIPLKACDLQRVDWFMGLSFSTSLAWRKVTESLSFLRRMQGQKGLREGSEDWLKGREYSCSDYSCLNINIPEGFTVNYMLSPIIIIIIFIIIILNYYIYIFVFTLLEGEGRVFGFVFQGFFLGVYGFILLDHVAAVVETFGVIELVFVLNDQMFIVCNSIIYI